MKTSKAFSYVKWESAFLSDAVEIYDTLRKPINSKERNARIAGKKQSDLYPYYGATGQVGYIDDGGSTKIEELINSITSRYEAVELSIENAYREKVVSE
jgi:hypothetical protein